MLDSSPSTSDEVPFTSYDSLEHETCLADLLNFEQPSALDQVSFLQGEALDVLDGSGLDFNDLQGIKAEPSASEDLLGGTDNETGEFRSGKRRRRIRNQKQQELNRLAQQRYRQRKKEKYSELQVAVNSLQEKMDQLSVLEKEASKLRTDKDELTKQLQRRDAALTQANNAIRSQMHAVRLSNERCTALEKQVTEQQGVIEQQRQQVVALRSASVLASGMDPHTLSDQLMSIIKAALSTASQESEAAARLTSEEVVAHIRRSLTSCCRELIYSSGSSSPAMAKASAAAETAPSIPVSCC